MKMRIPTNEEYDWLVDLTGGSDCKMHWGKMFTWVESGIPQHNPPFKSRAVRGYYSARYWHHYTATYQYVYVGFRPAVELCETDASSSGIQKGESCVMGTLYMDGRPIKVPTCPGARGNVAEYIPGAKLEMREALDDPHYQVTGFRVGDTLIADRVLLNRISYEDIEAVITDSEKDNAQPIAENTKMPAVVGAKTKGESSMKMRIPTDEECDKLAALTDRSNDKMHWDKMWTWIKSEEPCDTLLSKACEVRGYVSPRTCSIYHAKSQNVCVGFRPAVESCETGALGSDIQKGKPCVIGTLYMDGLPVKVPADPTETGDVSAYIPGAKLEMREALDDPHYQVTGFRVGDTLIADRVLLNEISYEDIEAALAREPDCENMEIPAAMSVDTPLGAIVVKTATDSEHPGVYIDLRRKGCECDMPLALVEFCGDEGDKPHGEKNIITRVWGDAAQEDYTDRVVHKGIEDYFSEDADEYVIIGAPGLAIAMLHDLGNNPSTGYYVIAQGRQHPENHVSVTLLDETSDLPDKDQYYTIHLVDDVRPADCELYHTEARTEESLVKLMTEILDGLK